MPHVNRRSFAKATSISAASSPSLRGGLIRTIRTPRIARAAGLFAIALAAVNAGCSDGAGSGTGGSGTGGAGGGGGTTTTSITDAPPGWVLAWSDEFNGADGSAPDPVRWTVLEGGDGWGNEERQYYTADPANVRVEGGALVLTAMKEGANAHGCWYGTCQYTSARLHTKGKLERQHGRFEARIQVPSGKGLWPAFWLLGSNIDVVSWPACGEIDIMENLGSEPGTVHGSMHGPAYSAGAALTDLYTLPDGQAFADESHVFAVEWEESVVRFYVDDNLYETRTPADLPADGQWVFEQPFYILLNLAVGGQWPGDPDASTVFPQSMKVDYVRLYERP